MSFKRFLKKQGLLSCLLAFPFLGMSTSSTSSQVAPPSIECLEQFGVKQCADLLIERLKLAEELAVYKWNHHLPLTEDQEQAFVQNLVAQSDVKILDAASMERFFAAQLDASQVIIIEHFESWVKEGIDQHKVAPDAALLQKKLNAVDKQLLTTFNGLMPLLCGHKKEELKIALSQALLDAGFSRDTIDAATRF